MTALLPTPRTRAWLTAELVEVAAESAALEPAVPALKDLAFGDFCRLLSIRKKDGTLVSFAPENWHAEQLRFIADRTYRNVTLKDRQIGFSTLLMALDLYFCIKRDCLPNVQIIVHDGDIAGQLFVTLRLWINQLKEQQRLPPTMYSNRLEVVFKAGGAVRIVEAGTSEQTAEGKGRSGTIHRLHVTELAFWKLPATTLGAVLSCVPDDGEVDIESTPNGPQGLFYKHVLAAQAGTSGYEFFFFGWLDHAEYCRAVPVSFDPTPRDDHEKKARALGATDEQIVWWRSKVDDPSTGLDKALQEYPVDPESCFEVRDIEGVVVPEFKRSLHLHARPLPRFAHTYTAMDPGTRDKFGIVWGYWDYRRAVLVIQRSWAERNVTTSTVAALINQVEHELWFVDKAGGEREATLRYWDVRASMLLPAPFRRVSDTDTQVIIDLSRDYEVKVSPTAKDNAEAQLYALRNAFKAGQIEIVPKSGPLEEQLLGGRYNEKRTDWERSDELGHLDCIAALIYLWRNVRRTLDPWPVIGTDNLPPSQLYRLSQQPQLSDQQRAFIEGWDNGET